MQDANNTKKTFDTVLNEALSRYKGTNFLVGDRVNFVKNFLQHEWTKKQPPVKIERMKAIIESGNNIRVSAVKSLKPATAQTGHFEDVDDFYIDVVCEYAPGLFHGVFTVPQEVIELVEDYPSLAPIPDNQIRKSPGAEKPKSVETGKSETVTQTGTDSTTRNLPTQNTVIPSATPPKQYTGKYMES